MAEEPTRDPELDVVTPMKINRKSLRELREFDGNTAANPSSRAKRYKGALLAVHKPSYCLKRGVGSLQCGGESLRFQHRSRLFQLLSQLLQQHNWPEASGVLSVLIQGTVKDRSLFGNRAKYTTEVIVECRSDGGNVGIANSGSRTNCKMLTILSEWVCSIQDLRRAALELLSVIKGGNLSSRRIQSVYELWMKKLGPLKFWSTKDKFAVQLEFILTCLQHGSMEDAYQAALCLMQERGFDGDPVANLVVGLAFCQLWYSGIPKELQLSALDSSDTYMQPKIPIDTIYMPIEYSKEDNAHGAGSNSVIQCDSDTSVANDKEVDESNGNPQKKSIDTEAKVKKETSYTSYEPQDSCGKSAQPIGISDSSFPNSSDDLPRASIFHTQGLPPWLLPMKLPSSHENLEDAAYIHRNLLNDYYKSAVKHLRVALHSMPPAIEALHPLIQMLILGDQVHEALDELETLFHTSDTILQLRLQASLLEHFDSGNYVKLCTCFEDILKKDPTSSDSLSKLVLMHQRGDYDTQRLAEMIALHLDASYGTCGTWQELASCLLKLSQCEGDRVSVCNDESDAHGGGCLDDSNRIPELFTCGESGNSWRLRAKWWLNRHFHNRILMSDVASGDLKLLTYKAAAASHIYGRRFTYVVKTTESLENENNMELYSFLQTHILNSVGFCTVQGRS